MDPASQPIGRQSVAEIARATDISVNSTPIAVGFI
jgi:hypothetical protein